MITGWLFISPWVVGFILLTAYPFAASLYWSFCRYDMLTPPRFVGGDNYARLAHEMLHGGEFRTAMWNTAYYALLSAPLSVAIGVLLAVMLNWKVRGRAVFRTLVYLPSVAPVVAASVLWMWLLDPEKGLVNYALGLVGAGGHGWLRDPGEVLFSASMGSKDGLILMGLWGVGNFMIIYLAALQDIPRSLYEAAQLDGAGALRRFWHVTLPMLSPLIFFNLVMSLIHSVQAFTQIYIVSEGTGEPAGSTLVLSLHLFLAAFQDLEMGYASAIAWMLFLTLVALTAALFRSARYWVHYGEA